jgi:hypothetical protein
MVTFKDWHASVKSQGVKTFIEEDDYIVALMKDGSELTYQLKEAHLSKNTETMKLSKAQLADHGSKVFAENLVETDAQGAKVFVRNLMKAEAKKAYDITNAFEKVVNDIKHRDKCNKQDAMRKARLEYPDEFAAYQNA